MKRIKLSASHPHPEDLDSGRTLAPGEVVQVRNEELAGDRAQALIDADLLFDLGSDDDGELTGKALEDRAKELDIPGRSDMKADELRAAVAAAEAEQADNDNQEG